MKKILVIVVLGLLLSGNAYAEENKNERVYLECKTPGGPYNGYGISHELSHVMVPDGDSIDMVPLKITAGRYDFEYFPLKNRDKTALVNYVLFKNEKIIVNQKNYNEEIITEDGLFLLNKVLIEANIVLKNYDTELFFVTI